MQTVLTIPDLPESAIEAAAAFHAHWLGKARSLFDEDAEPLAIVLPAAGKDHDDWRRAIARDLGRAHAPRRVNVVGANAGETREKLLAYLAEAPGVTGQYLVGHD